MSAAEVGSVASEPAEEPAVSAEPILLSRRTGRTIAAVVAFGFGGGTVLLGLTTTLSTVFSSKAALAAFRGYFLAALPLFAFAALLALCKRELWWVPEARALRMLTFRPWRLRGPRVEQAPVEDYAAVCMVRHDHDAERSTMIVALVSKDGTQIPVRELDDVDEAERFAAKLSHAMGLTLRHTVASDPAP